MHDETEMFFLVEGMRVKYNAIEGILQVSKKQRTYSFVIRGKGYLHVFLWHDLFKLRSPA